MNRESDYIRKRGVKRIDSLTSMRFWMMVIIFLSHLEFLKLYEYGDIYMKYFHNPAVAVDFFFMLSGFGLAYSNKKVEKINLKSSLMFGIERVKKIYGCYVAMLIFCIPYCLLWDMENGKNIVHTVVDVVVKLCMGLTMLQSATGLSAVSHLLNGVGWFLSTLFVLYILCPAILKLNEKIEKRIKRIITVFIFNTIAMLVFYKLFYLIEGKTIFDDLVYGSPYIRVFYLIGGVLISDIVKYLKRYKVNNIVNNIVGITVVFLNIGWFFFRNTCVFDVMVKYVIDYSLCGLLIYVCIDEKGIVSRILSADWNVKLGQITMYIYLIHYPIRMYIDWIYNKLNIPRTMSNGFIEVLLIIVITSIIVMVISFYKSSKRKDNR